MSGTIGEDRSYTVCCMRRQLSEGDKYALARSPSAHRRTLPVEQASLFEDKPETSVDSEEERNGGSLLKCLCRTFGVHLGLLLAVVSCVVEVLASMGIKMLAGRIPPTQVAAFRLTFYFLCSAILIVYYRIPVRLSKRQAWWLGLRITVGVTGMCLSYYGYQNIPVGDSTAILFSSPIITGVLAWMLLGEKFTIVDAALAVVTLTGIVLIARPTFLFGDLHASAPEGGNATLGVTASLIGAFFGALVYVTQRKLGSISVHPFVQTSAYGLGGTVLTCLLTTVLGVWEVPGCGRERVILIMIGFLGFVAQLLMTYAFMHEKATYVALIKSNNVIFAFVFQFLFFGTVPYWLTAVGACLIFSSCVTLTLKKWRAAHRKKGGVGSSEAHVDGRDSESNLACSDDNNNS